MQRCSIQSAAEIKESGNGCGQALPGLGSLCDMGLQKPTAWPRGAPARQTETAVRGGPDLAFYSKIHPNKTCQVSLPCDHKPRRLWCCRCRQGVFRALVIIEENPHWSCLFEILYYRSVSGKVNLDTVRHSEDFSQIMWDKVCAHERMAEAYPPKPRSLSQPLNPLPHYSSLN